jgi:hypothetical protein
MADGSQNASVAQDHPATDSKLQQTQEASEAGLYSSLDRFKTKFQSLKTEFGERNLKLSPLSQPSTQHLIQEYTEPKPRDLLTLARCTLANSSWELDDEELLVHVDEKALELDMSVKHPRKRPADFAESHD